MKKLIVVGVLALVVIGCVLAAGCTSQSTPSTTGTDSVVGTWTLPNGTTVVFGNDFKGVMTQGENKINFTWKKTTDGKYQVDNEKGEQVIWTMDSSKNSMTNPAGMILTKKASTVSGASINLEIPLKNYSDAELVELYGVYSKAIPSSEKLTQTEFMEIASFLKDEDGRISELSGAMREGGIVFKEKYLYAGDMTGRMYLEALNSLPLKEELSAASGASISLDNQLVNYSDAELKELYGVYSKAIPSSSEKLTQSEFMEIASFLKDEDGRISELSGNMKDVEALKTMTAREFLIPIIVQKKEFGAASGAMIDVNGAKQLNVDYANADTEFEEIPIPELAEMVDNGWIEEVWIDYGRTPFIAHPIIVSS